MRSLRGERTRGHLFHGWFWKCTCPRASELSKRSNASLQNGSGKLSPRWNKAGRSGNSGSLRLHHREWYAEKVVHVLRLIVRCRGINIRPVKSVKIAPSATRTFYEMIINTGPDDYRVTLTPSMFGELIRSARDALEGRVPAVEERAATQLPMNPGNMLLVRLNVDGLRIHTPENLYLQLFQTWKNGFFQRYSAGTVQQTIRQEAVKEIPVGEFGKLDRYVEIWSSAEYDGPLRRGDILLQRISGTRANLGRPFFVESAEPLVIRGA